MNAMQIFNSPEFGEIRTIIINGDPWFVSKDISEKLGYVKPANMVKLVDDDDKRNVRSSDLELSSRGAISDRRSDNNYPVLYTAACAH